MNEEADASFNDAVRKGLAAHIADPAQQQLALDAVKCCIDKWMMEAKPEHVFDFTLSALRFAFVAGISGSHGWKFLSRYSRALAVMLGPPITPPEPPKWSANRKSR